MTLDERVLTDMVMVHRGTDRVALVRSIQDRTSPAICVIMTSKQALRRLGKPIVNIARKLGNAPAEFGCPEITEQMKLNALFEIADAAPNGWCWASFRYYKLNVTLAIFCRSLDDVAQVCNRNGAPCSLDAKNPAPGYEIEQILNRR